METRFEDIEKNLLEAMRMDILTERNIRDIEYALRKVNNEPKEPYAEFVYHDEYGQENRYRIEPTNTIITENGVTNHYEMNIRKFIRK
jgi:hypothetical protein